MNVKMQDTSLGDDGIFVQAEDPATTALPPPPNATINEDDVYQIFLSAIPILCTRLIRDSREWIHVGWDKAIHFLLPFRSLNPGISMRNSSFSKTLGDLWNQTVPKNNILPATASVNKLVDFILKHLDLDKDGQISRIEIMNMKDQLPHLMGWSGTGNLTKFPWWQMAWPMFDMKVGVFLWRTCGGLLLVIALFTIIPGITHRYTGKLLRWPILAVIYFMIIAELNVYIIVRMVIRLAEAVFANPKHRALRIQMSNAKSYKEWYQIATELDISKGRDKWQRTTEDEMSKRYNWALIIELMADMRLARNTNDSIMALAVLQQCTRKNVGGIMSDELFSYTYTGEPKLIVNEFINEVVTTLEWVTDQAMMIPDAKNVDKHIDVVKRYEMRLNQKVDEEKSKVYRHLLTSVSLPNEHTPGVTETDVESTETDNSHGINTKPSSKSSFPTTNQHLPSFHRIKVKIFLKRARAAYGRTALCLSGGSMMGNYHFGAVKALLEEGVLPHIISGTSAGSIIGGFICTHSDKELKKILKPEILVEKLTCFDRSWSECIKGAWNDGNMFDVYDWFEKITWFVGDLTFEEAYRKTGRVLCITLSATTKKSPPVLLSYISAPNVVIASAIIASAAVPGFISPMLLQIKDSNGKVQNQGINKGQLYRDGSIEQDIPITGLAEMFNCQFFLASQCNPHIVPFFYNTKGEVGKPSRWGNQGSWRGGFLLSAMEMYLKYDMRAKFHFLNDLEAAVGFTGTLLTQTYSGSTTIVPQVVLEDYFKLFSDPTLKDMNRYFQSGSVAAYQHFAMVKLQCRLSSALDVCLSRLEHQENVNTLR